MKFWDDVKRRGRAVRYWLVAGNPLWLTLALLAWLILLPYHGLAVLNLTPVERLRITGLVLQIFGILSVVLGLHRSRQLFERPGYWKTFTSWMRQLLPVFKGPKTKIKPIGTAIEGNSAGKVSALKASGKSRSLEERICYLEDSVAKLKRELPAETEETRQAFEGSLKEEERKRNEEDQRLSQKLEEAVIGGIHIELAGLAFLILGVILGTAPDHVARMLGL